MHFNNSLESLYVLLDNGIDFKVLPNWAQKTICSLDSLIKLYNTVQCIGVKHFQNLLIFKFCI